MDKITACISFSLSLSLSLSLWILSSELLGSFCAFQPSWFSSPSKSLVVLVGWFILPVLFTSVGFGSLLGCLGLQVCSVTGADQGCWTRWCFSWLCPTATSLGCRGGSRKCLQLVDRWHWQLVTGSFIRSSFAHFYNCWITFWFPFHHLSVCCFLHLVRVLFYFSFFDFCTIYQIISVARIWALCRTCITIHS